MSAASRKRLTRSTPHRPAAGPTESLSKSEKIEQARQRKLREIKKRQATAGILFTAGGVVAISHVMEHAGVFHVFSSGADDLVMGYPMALLLVVFGAVRLGPR
jgi:hypothetical protein